MVGDDFGMIFQFFLTITATICKEIVTILTLPLNNFCLKILFVFGETFLKLLLIVSLKYLIHCNKHSLIFNHLIFVIINKWVEMYFSGY